jgi:anaerobic magnesium-protoporphyrin IX monomethyl ester cyclase
MSISQRDVAMTRDKTAVIVFPPFNTPTSPPLGPAMLKGFVERELPGWQVKVFDLNLWTFNRMLAAVARGDFKLDPRAFAGGDKAAENLMRAAEAFRGNDNESFYDRPEDYNRFGEVFFRFSEVCKDSLVAACEAHEAGVPRHPFLQEFVDAILAEKPDVVGFSVIFSHQIPVGAMLGRILRTEHKLPVLFGGSCLADSAEHFLKWYPQSADLVVAGEGEDALKQFLSDPTAPEKVPGAVYFGPDGAVRKVEKAYTKSIDYYGIPDFSDTDPKKYFSPEPIVPLLLSRGCYWRRCTFCVHYRSAGLTYRVHSMDFTIDMLKGFVNQGIRHFNFIDEMISPPHFERLATGIKEAGLDIAYYALTKPTAEFTSEKLVEMAESGCKYLLWGLESANQRVLDLMDKGSKIADVSRLMKRSYAAGITNHVFMICGFPTETEAEFAETIKFLDDHKDYIFAVHKSTFGLEPESPIFHDAERFGIIKKWLIRDNPTGGRWGYEVSSGMSQKRVMEVMKQALPFLREFNPYARYLGNYRDHALLIYDRRGGALRPSARPFPQVNHSLVESTPWTDEEVVEQRSMVC